MPLASARAPQSHTPRSSCPQLFPLQLSKNLRLPITTNLHKWPQTPLPGVGMAGPAWTVRPVQGSMRSIRPQWAGRGLREHGLPRMTEDLSQGSCVWES